MYPSRVVTQVFRYHKPITWLTYLAYHEVYTYKSTSHCASSGNAIEKRRHRSGEHYADAASHPNRFLLKHANWIYLLRLFKNHSVMYKINWEYQCLETDWPSCGSIISQLSRLLQRKPYEAQACLKFQDERKRKRKRKQAFFLTILQVPIRQSSYHSKKKL